MRRHDFLPPASTLLTAAALILVAPRLDAATITIVNLDGAGEGFNDPTPAAPVGGNPGTTLGAQRLYVFQYAANIWGAKLPSAVQIRVEANFDPQDCDATSGVLGSAGPNSLHSDFPNAPYPATLYHQALANRLATFDLDPSADIGATFNSAIGAADCLPQGWYLGVDGNEGSQIELLPVVLHELGHGLGFSTSTLAGVEIEGLPHVYDRFLYDNTVGMHWNEMPEGARAASAQNCQNLVWDGPNVTARAPERLGPKPVLHVNAPEGIAGDYNVGLPQFGPALTAGGLTADVVLAIDPLPPVNNGCEPFLNAAQMAGKIALIDRGGCTFVTKVKNAQNAGAIGVVVADSTPGCPPIGMGGADPTITIPSVRVTQDVGVQLKTALAQGLNVTMKVDPSQRAGADANGRVLVYTPAPFQLGSSVSHWDTSAEPSLLMEPAITNGLSSDVDLTLSQFADIGWFEGLLGVENHVSQEMTLEPGIPNPTRSTATIAYSLAREDAVELAIYDASGRRVAELANGREGAGRHTVRWSGLDTEGRAVPAGIYQVRLRTSRLQESKSLVVVR